MNDKFKMLEALGAGEFEHLDGSLISHLQGTRELLRQWKASSTLQDAGLYHAAYGTAGFSRNLVDTTQRKSVALIIGKEAEELVYQYCACERSAFLPLIGQDSAPAFTNRFTGESYQLTSEVLRDFCELTAANEVEIAIDNPDFISQYGKGLNTLFTNMSPFLSAYAREQTAKIFDSVEA